MKIIKYDEMTDKQKMAYNFANRAYIYGNCTLIQAIEFLKKTKIIIEE
jgi:hypothetical protein